MTKLQRNAADGLFTRPSYKDKLFFSIAGILSHFPCPRAGQAPRILAAAAITESSTCLYPVQRHNTPDMASRTSSSVGLGFYLRKW